MKNQFIFPVSTVDRHNKHEKFPDTLHGIQTMQAPESFAQLETNTQGKKIKRLISWLHWVKILVAIWTASFWGGVIVLFLFVCLFEIALYFLTNSLSMNIWTTLSHLGVCSYFSLLDSFPERPLSVTHLCCWCQCRGAGPGISTRWTIHRWTENHKESGQELRNIFLSFACRLFSHHVILPNVFSQGFILDGFLGHLLPLLNTLAGTPSSHNIKKRKKKLVV